MSVLGLVAGYGRHRLSDPRARFVGDRLGDHKKRGEKRSLKTVLRKKAESVGNLVNRWSKPATILADVFA